MLPNFIINGLNDLDYINITMRYIRKIQSKCNLISIFENNKNENFSRCFLLIN